MNISETVVELKRSGYTDSQIVIHLEQMHNIYVNEYMVRRFADSVKGRINEIQNYLGKPGVMPLLEKCPVDTFMKYYLVDKAIFDAAALERDFGFSYTDIELITTLIFNPIKTDCFSLGIREKIFKADKYTCRRCCKELPKEKLDTHHIVPGGGDHYMNGITLCNPCHRLIHKSGMPDIGKHIDRKTWNRQARQYKLDAATYKRNKKKKAKRK